MFGQRMTHARGCASDTLPWGTDPTSPPAGRQDGGCWVPLTCKQPWGCAVCRQRAPEVVGHSHADSGSGVRLAGRCCGVHVVDLCKSLYLLGAILAHSTNGVCSPPLSSRPWSERRAGSVGPEPGGPAPRRGVVKHRCVRVRQVARGQSWLWGRDRDRPVQGRGPSGPA